MAKQLLSCDICGGSIAVQAGGKLGICANCGANYTLERMREMYSGMKVSVTGTAEDVTQWKVLLETYVSNCDFVAAEHVVKKILEAIPSDETANALYVKLRDWKECDIKNGILIKYNGQSSNLILPDGIRQIGLTQNGGQEGAFANCQSLVSITLPESVVKIEARAFEGCNSLEAVVFSENISHIGFRAFEGCRKLNNITLPASLTHIGASAFRYCSGLTEISIPDSVTTIEGSAFEGCSNLKIVKLPASLGSIEWGTFAQCNKLASITIPNGVSTIEREAFAYCRELKSITIPTSVKEIVPLAFTGCASLANVKHSGGFSMYSAIRVHHADDDDKYLCAFAGTPYEGIQKEEERSKRRRNGLCQYCGGGFTGLFTKTCSCCGIRKDY